MKSPHEKALKAIHAKKGKKEIVVDYSKTNRGKKESKDWSTALKKFNES